MLNYKLPIEKKIATRAGGFTLIELLVGISIVAVVSAIVATSLAAVSRNGRDGKRKADLANISVALQKYYADAQQYPLSLALGSDVTLTNCTGVTGACTVSQVYFRELPTDPKSGGGQRYCYQSQKTRTDSSACTGDEDDCQFYHLYTRLESEPAGAMSCDDGAVLGNLNYVTNP